MGTDTSNYSRSVQFTPDGEGIDLTDMINMQLFRRLHEINLLMSGVHPNIVGDPGAPGDVGNPTSNEDQAALGASISQLVLAPHGGAAFVYATAVARQIAITPGAICTFSDEPWTESGEEFATFRSGGYLLTTGVGDAANPRIDLVEIKLEYINGDPQSRHFEDATTREPTSQAGTNKERQVKLTYQIKAGTPAASPAYPSPSVGFLPLAAIWIPQNHNAVHSPANIRDMRMPLGLRVVDVDFRQFQYTGAQPWTDLSGAIATTGINSTDVDYVIAVCPNANPGARLVGVGIHCSLGDDATCELISRSYPASNGAPTDTVIAYVGDDMALGGGFTYVDMIQIMDSAGNGVPTFAKGSRAAGLAYGTPVWCNGTTGGNANRKATPNDGADVDTKLALRFACDGTGVSGPGGRASFVRFYIAEGL